MINPGFYIVKKINNDPGEPIMFYNAQSKTWSFNPSYAHTCVDFKMGGNFIMLIRCVNIAPSLK